MHQLKIENLKNCVSLKKSCTIILLKLQTPEGLQLWIEANQEQDNELSNKPDTYSKPYSQVIVQNFKGTYYRKQR